MKQLCDFAYSWDSFNSLKSRYLEGQSKPRI